MSESFTSNRGRSRAIGLLPLIVLVGVWVGLLSMDWVMRFQWFHWQRTFISSSAHPRYMGDFPPLTTNMLTVGQVGDLAKMLGAQMGVSSNSRGTETHIVTMTDEFGLPNVLPTTGLTFNVFLAGDSFMLQGGGTSNYLGAKISHRLGEPVYTVAHAGRGPAYPISGAIIHPYFLQQTPRELIWGVAERDATGFTFDSMAFELMSLLAGSKTSARLETRILWKQLVPVKLEKSLPNTSAVAQTLRKTWSRALRAVSEEAPSSVVISTRPLAGSPLLFYRPNIRALFRTGKEWNVEKSARAAFYVNQEVFKPKDIQWVIVLIPEKEQIYHEYIPRDAYPRDTEWPSSVFEKLAPALHESGIIVVNLLPAFQAAARRGEMIYWSDDTHWNERGLQIAAEEIVKVIRAERTGRTK